VTTVLLATAALLAGATLVGGGGLALSGLHGPRGCTPALGLAALMVVLSPLSRLPHGATVAAVALVALPLAALLVPDARRIALGLLPWGAGVAVVMLVLLALPYLAAGHDGLLGMGMNNDTAIHLVAARWLLDRGIPEADTLVGVGYPIGPHAIAAAFASIGTSLAHGLTAVSTAAPVAAALAALGALPAARRSARALLAVVVGMSYLFISYYAQFSFKETLAAAFMLAFAVVLARTAQLARQPRAAGGAVVEDEPAPDATGAAGAVAPPVPDPREPIAAATPRAAMRASIAPAVLAAGMVHILSWAGLIWPIAVLCVWLAVEVLMQRRSPLAVLASVRTALGAGVLALVVLIVPEIPRIVAFQGSRYAHEPDHGLGNLEGTLPAYKTLGLWLDPDFRFASRAPVLVSLLIVAAGLLMLVGARRWWVRRDRVLVAAFAAGWLVWIGLDLTKNAYDAAKALPIVAPLGSAALGTGAVVAWRSGRAALARRAVVVAVIAVSLASSAWALREAVVGVDAHHRELQTLAAAAPPGPVFVLDNSDWAAWDLYGVQVWQPPLLYATHTVPMRTQKNHQVGEPFDFDTVDPTDLNRFGSIVTARNMAGSAPPPGLKILRQTASFTLWKRTGTVPGHQTLDEGWQPGAVLDCNTATGRQLSQSKGWALVRPAPVIASPQAWHGTARSRGTSAWQELHLGPGRWDLALQYVSRNPLEIHAGTAHATVPGNLDRLTSFFTVGTTQGGTITFRVAVRAPGSLVPDLLGATNSTRALDSFNHQPLGMVVATPHGQAPHRVPLAQACGRYVDQYQTTG
jgi:hypothetical protein